MNSGEVERDQSRRLVLPVFCILLVLILGFQYEGRSQTVYETFPAGSYIIDMGVVPQTLENGTRPFGLLYRLMKEHQIPVKWIINPTKSKDGIDFSHNGKNFRGGPFIVHQQYRNAAVDALVSNWISQGVVVNTTVSPITVPVFITLSVFMEWTLDDQNGSIAEDYLESAGVPPSSYNWKLPSELDCCDDIFVMPHADPEWETHSNLYFWNDRFENGGCKGSIYASCHAVSALENLYNPSNPSQQMNFLSNKSGPILDDPYAENSLVLWGDHKNGSGGPYQYFYPSDPEMQFMGVMDPATEGGSEQIYIPYYSWRPTTKLNVIDPFHEEVPSEFPGPAVKMAYGPAFGDPYRGRIMYVGGHSLDGDDPDEVSAQRNFFNFSFYTVQLEAPGLSIDVPALMEEGKPYTLTASVAEPDAGPFLYEWSSTCAGTFSSITDTVTVFTPTELGYGVDCIISCKITTLPCLKVSYDSKPVHIQPQLPPVAVNDNAVTNEDTPVTVNVTNNDYDPDGYIVPSTISTTGLLQPANGITSINPVTGAITYTPNPDYNGTDQFEYSVCDDGGPFDPKCDVALVTVNVIPMNDPPVAVDDSKTTNEDTFVNINVLANDYDVDGSLVPSSVTTSGLLQPANGSILINPVTGVIRYTPNPNFNGVDQFEYQVCDDGSPVPPLCDIALVTITVIPTNDPPVAVDDNASTPEDAAVNIAVTSNDYDVDGNIVVSTLSTTGLLQPANGIATINPATGGILYTPDPNFNGVDQFEYSICDDGVPLPSLCDVGLVTVTVLAGNDPPVAVDDIASTNEDIPVVVNVVANDYDIDGNVIASSVSTAGLLQPANGSTTINPVSGAITYTPDPNFYGTDQFEYSVCDDGNPLPIQCDIALVTITVNAVNDPPLANNDVAGTLEDTPVNINVLANDSDPDGMLVPASVNTTGLLQPGNGSTSINPVNGQITYTPNLNFTGTDQFEYQVCDDGNPSPSLCDIALVVVNVSSQNDPPVAVDDFASTSEENAVVINVVANDSDPDGSIDPMTVSTAGLLQPVNGTISVNPATGAITYTPDPNFYGTDQFEYTVCDNGNPLPVLCDIASVYVTVNPVNDPPLANDDNAATDEETPVIIFVLDNDSDPDGTLDSTSVSTAGLLQPLHGTTSINPVSGAITYSPVADYYGTDVFQYSVCDDGNPAPPLCDMATVTVFIGGTNDPPIAQDDAAVTWEDTPVIVNVVNNDVDFDGVIDPTTVSSSGLLQPANGTTSINPITGQITYIPDPNFNGVDQFAYSVCDDGGPVLCDVALVTIFIGSINDPPVAIKDIVTTPEETPIIINILANDFDPDGMIVPSSVTTSGLLQPSNGTVSINPVSGAATYTPNANFNGIDEFEYSVCDNGSPVLCAVALVKVTVTPVNDPPVALDDAASTPEETPVLINILSNDYDIDGTIDPSSASTLGFLQPTSGTVTINPVNGTATYTPDENFNGIDQFEYHVCDNGAPVLCDVALVTVTVQPVNDPPVAVDDFSATSEDNPVVVNVLTNDTDPDGSIDPTTVSTAGLLQPQHGSTSINPITGAITYNPDANYNGTDQFEYQVCDDGNPSPVLCDIALVSITVNPVNDPPLAVNDNVATPEETAVMINVLSNDSDPDGYIVPGSILIVDQPDHGLITAINPTTGAVTYMPGPSYNGSDSFVYTICDNGDPSPSLCDNATVSITVTPVNDPPVAVDDLATGTEDTPLLISVLNNDYDSDGTLVPSSVSTSGLLQPAHGDVYVNTTTGSITFVPDANFNGVDQFEYQVCDDGNPSPVLCDIALVTVTVNPANDPPVAVNDAATTQEDIPISINVINNDYDIDGNILASTVSTAGLLQAANGNAYVNPITGSITYVPNPNYTGTDQFEYQVCDDGTPLPSLCDVALVNITVVAVNDPPVAADDGAATSEDTPVTVDVLANDTDIDGNLVPSSVSTTGLVQPTNGSTSINPLTGAITYTPNANFFGSDEFEYTVCDDGTPLPSLCDVATVTITIGSVNDPPVAGNDFANTGEDTPVQIFVINNDIDIDGYIDTASISLTGMLAPANGTVTADTLTGSVIYTPNTNFNGTDQFEYTICDNGIPVLCDVALVTVIVNSTNDPPVANNDNVTTPEDTPIAINVIANDTDPDGLIDPTSVSTTGLLQPAHGSTSINPVTGFITYTPNANYFGTDQFEYNVCDDGTPTLCDVALVTITISPVNDPPVAVNDNATTAEDVSILIPVINNDYDPDGAIVPSTVSISGLLAAAHGNTYINPITGSITYVPNPNYNGTDQFEYSVCDNGSPQLCDVALVTITINPVNDPPVANDDNATTPEDTPVSIAVISNDVDLDGFINPATVSTSGLLQPLHGATSINPVSGAITYTPNLNYFGSDQFEYSVCDNGSPVLCDVALVTVTINSVNDPPVAVNDNGTTPEDIPVTINVASNDSDPDGAIVPSSVTTAGLLQPSNGTTSINPLTGAITYTPASNFNGTDNFEYSICDDGSPTLCDVGLVTVNVISVNDPPIAVDDNASTPEDTPLAINVTANDTDPDGVIDPATVSTAGLLQPLHGTTSINPISGSITYIPALNYNGTDQFEYSVCDNGSPVLCDIALVTVTINPVNDPPIANNDNASTSEDVSILINVISNDSDPDGVIVPGSVSIAGLLPASNGNTYINPITGSITYVPNPNFNGVDQFEYSVCDNGSPVLCDIALVTVTVVPKNDPPVAVDDYATTPEDVQVVIDLDANDYDIDGVIVPLTMDIIQFPVNGNLIAADPFTAQITYLPNPDFYGTDSLSYSICDNGSPLPSLCDVAMVYITVSPVNDPPLALDDNAVTNEEVAVVINVPINDFDIDGNIVPSSVSVSGVMAPANGSLSINPVTGAITYTPDFAFYGTDQFQYTICDDGTPLPSLCDTATVTVSVIAVNDPPVAIDDFSSTPEDTPVIIYVTSNDSDPDGAIDPGSVTTSGFLQPTNGTTSINPVTGAITYTPNPDFNGTDQFEYQVCDNEIVLDPLCDIALVTVTVTAQNDPPVAVDDYATTPEETAVTVPVLDNDYDVDGDLVIFSVTVVSDPSNGSITGVNPFTGVVTYAPDANFYGTDVFSYIVCDNGTPLPSLCDTAEVYVTVSPINDPPLVLDDNATTPEDVAVVINVTANDSDVDGNIDPASVSTSGLLQPAHGTTSINPVTGAITYTPDPNYNGTDQFEYQVCDDGFPLPVLCDIGLVTVTVTPINDPPVAVDDIVSTPEEQTLVIPILGNDYDPDGSLVTFSLTITDMPNFGNITAINPFTGAVTYVPDPGYFGPDQFTYFICDNGNPAPSLCDTAVVYIDVLPVNDPPIANDDNATTPEDNSVTVDVTGNDTDSDGNIDPTSVTTAGLLQPLNGTTSINPTTGAITYTPNPNFNGTDQFEYQVCDDGTPLPALCDVALVTITVNAVNDPPVANDDNATTPEDNPVTVDVTSNDTDLDGNIVPSSVTTSGLLQASNGSTSINPVTGAITYTPNPGFNGTDQFEYQVCDDGTPLPSLCDVALVTITINAVNDPPIANDDNASTPEDNPVTVDVTANDADSDGNIDPTSVTTAGLLQPLNGTTSINPTTGAITYTPNPNFNGTDQFEYEVCDDGTPLPALCDVALVTITINAVNDPPVANDDSATTPEDNPVTVDITANDTDLDGNIVPSSVTTAGLLQASNGSTSINPVTGAITYTPNPGFNGTDQFQYQVCDDGTPLPALCDAALVTITINAVNDPPIANDDNATTPEDNPVTVDVTANDTDSDGNIDPTSVTTAGLLQPLNGTTSINPTTGAITYTPNPNFNGTDQFEYEVCDDGTPLPALCDVALVTITINAVNDPPVANDDSATTPEDNPVTVDVTSNDTDLDGNIVPSSVTTAGLLQPTNGSTSINPVTGAITYTPNPGFNGTDQFEYQVCDDGTPLPALCDVALVTITINAVNDPPIANDDNATTPEDNPVTVDVTANDTDSDGNIDPTSVTTAGLLQPLNGTTSINPTTGAITYTPNPNFNGTDQFEYQVCDDGTPLPALCDIALVTITVNAVNDPPIANDDNATTPEDNPVTVDVTANDTDLDGNIVPSSVTTSGLLQPLNGSTSINPITGAITYTPNPGFNGSDQFEYQVCDDGTPLPALCDVALVVITIDAVNDPPIANDDTVTTPEDNTITIDVTDNDSDTDGNIDPSSVTTTGVLQPNNGNTSIDPVSGDITYTPDPNFYGIDTFEYIVCDDGTPLPSECDTALVTVNVTGINDPPVAVDDIVTTPEDDPIFVDVLDNDSDPDGDLVPSSVTNTGVEPPSNGSISIDPITGGITYTPNPDYFGPDSFEYIICDNGMPLPSECDTAWVIIDVLPVNDPPIALDDNDTLLEDFTTITTVLINDSDPDGTLDPTTLTVITGPENGTTSVDTVSGTITYIPDPDYNGNDTYTYLICDDGGLCDSAEVSIYVIPVVDPVDLELTKTVDNSVAILGETVTFQVVIFNNSNVDATGVIVLDNLPFGMTLVSSETTSGSFFGGVWNIGDLPAFASDTLWMEAFVSFSGTTYKNIAEVTAQDQVDLDSSPGNDNGDQSEDDEDFAIVTSLLVADLSVFVDVDQPLVNAGDTVTFTVLVENNGPLFASGVLLESIVPAGLNYVSYSSSTGSYNPGTGIWNVGTLSVGESEELNITVVVTGSGSYTLIAQVNAVLQADIDSTPDNDIPSEDDQDSATVSGQIVDLSLTKTAQYPGGGALVQAYTGDTVVYVIQVHNDGPSTATGVHIYDPLPANVSFLSATSSFGTYSPESGVWTINSIAPGITRTLSIYALVEEPGFFTNTAEVVSINQPDSDSEPDNHILSEDDMDNVTIEGLNIDLSLQKIVFPTEGLLLGDTVTYTITVSNDGYTDATGVSVLDQLNADLAFVSIPSITHGTYDQLLGIWYIGDLETGQSATLQLEAMVLVEDDIINISEVYTANEPDADSEPANGIVTEDDYDAVTIAVNPPPIADLAVLISAVPTDVLVGEEIDLTVTIQNFGPVAATGSVVETSIPAGLIPVGSSESSGSYNPLNSEWTIPYLSVGESAFLYITVVVDSAGDFTVIAELMEADLLDPDSSPGNGILAEDDMDQVVLGGIQIDLEVQKTIVGGTAGPYSTGDILSYQIIVANNPSGNPGISNASGVVLFDLLPPGVDFADYTSTAGTYNAATGYWTIGNINNGESDTLWVEVEVDGSGLINNSAQVFAAVQPDTDSSPNNNIASEDDQDAVSFYANSAPIANDDNATGQEDTPLSINILANDTDPDGNLDPTSVTILSPPNPAQGSVSVNPVTGGVIFTPALDYNGLVDPFTYQVCDLDGLCDSAQVFINLLPVNDPPIAITDYDTTAEDTPVSTHVLVNDYDPDGSLNPFTILIIDGPDNGSLTVEAALQQITYTPDPNFTGTDSYIYQVCDYGIPFPVLCDTAVVYITITEVNDPPVALDDVDITPEDTPVITDVTANDSDPNDPDGNIDPTTVSILTPPVHGSVSVDPITGDVTYTPSPNFNGLDTYTYLVCDTGTPLPPECDSATVTITVTPVNDPPVANDDAATSPEDTPVLIDITQNDSDPLDPMGGIDPSSVSIEDTPQNGTLSVNPFTGDVVYTPFTNFSGMDTFTYIICDIGNPLPALCDTAQVIVTILDSNDPPIAMNDVDTTLEDISVVTPILANDSDPGDALGNIDPSTVIIITSPSHGAVAVDPVTGDVTYTPDPNYNGLDQYAYSVCDDGYPLPELCDEAIVTIVVLPVNDPPQANNDAATTPEDTPVDINVSANDSDPLDPLGNIDPTTVSISFRAGERLG